MLSALMGESVRAVEVQVVLGLTCLDEGNFGRFDYFLEFQV